MVEMKSGEVVLSLAAQLASWRAVLVLVRTWATCKALQPKDFHQRSISLAYCLNQYSKETVWESVGGAAATESRKVGKGRRKRGSADADGPGANPEPELGPRGPTLKKQVRKGFEWLDLRLGLEPVERKREIRALLSWESARRERLFSSRLQAIERPRPPPGRFQLQVGSSAWVGLGPIVVSRRWSSPRFLDLEAMDPAGSPSPTRKVADTARPSSPSPSAATDPGWRSFFCLGSGK